MTTKLRILFVDDEQMLLNGLSRTFRPMRNLWDIETAISGSEALQKLKAHPFDVIVTDMRMSEMDGAELLGIVTKEYPHIIRILLSGQADAESLLRSIGSTHQYFSKPCDPDALGNAILRSCSLRDKMKSVSMSTLVSELDTLPTMPDVYIAVLDELKSAEPSLRRIAELIAKDIGMSSKILQIVNSARFGKAMRVSSPVEATMILGIDLVRSLLLAIHIFDLCPSDNQHGLSISWLWRHSLYVADCAKLLAEREGLTREQQDVAYAAGLLHDCGKLLIEVQLPGKYSEIDQRLEQGDAQLFQVERDMLGVTHADFGGYLLGLWGLSDTLVEAVVYHHTPSESLNTTISPLTAVHVAEALAGDDLLGIKRAAAELDNKYIETIGATGRVAEWQNLVIQQRNGGSHA